MKHFSWITSTLALSLLGCGDSTPATTPRPDSGTMSTRPRDTIIGSRPPTTVMNPGEAEMPNEDLPMDEMMAGSVTEGSDPVGSCLVLTMTGLTARTCVDYNEGFDATSAQAHCMGAMGTFVASMACDRTNVRFVSTCTITEEMRTRVVNAYRIPATRTEPDPVTITAAEVATWCQSQMGTSPMMPVPTNTGRCSYRTTENFLAVTMPGVAACINYDSGYTVEQATEECGGRTASTGEPTFAARSCSAGTATPGCRFTSEGRTWSVRYEWPFRSAAPWDNDMCMSETRPCFRRDCEAAGGTYFTGP